MLAWLTALCAVLAFALGALAWRFARALRSLEADHRGLEQGMELLSHSDPLTGVFNRRRFDEALAAQLAQARRYGRGGALLIADLDRFKQINDEFGHPAGDEALRLVARVLAENLRETDVVGRDEGGLVARLGGDEFALLLPETDAAGAEAVGERLVAALAAEPLRIGGRELRLGISIGVAGFGAGEFPSAEGHCSLQPIVRCTWSRQRAAAALP